MHTQYSWRSGALAALVVVAACGTLEAPDEERPTDAAVDASTAPDAFTTPDCESAQEPRTDVANRTWPVSWYCRNDGGAPVYAEARTGTLVANMDTVWSWFVCYRRGAPHVGGNDVWYYTQGDRAAPGQSAYQKWGYMPASNVRSAVHPHAGIPEC